MGTPLTATCAVPARPRSTSCPPPPARPRPSPWCCPPSRASSTGSPCACPPQRLRGGPRHQHREEGHDRRGRQRCLPEGLRRPHERGARDLQRAPRLGRLPQVGLLLLRR